MNKKVLIENTIYDKYINPKKPIALGISGGPDSVFAAYTIINRFKTKKGDTKNIHLIYCDHKTRKDNESAFIQEIFGQETSIHIITRPGKQEKVDEEKLRKRRYQSFSKIIQEIDAQALILGHNLTDRIETTFLNMLRGCHIDGFISMKIYTSSHHLVSCPIIRPLLELAKPTIEMLCKKHKIKYIIDPSNKDSTTSKRNKLRNEILPEIYNLAHKNAATENTFRTSIQNIYKEVSNKKTQNIDTQTYLPHVLLPEITIEIYNENLNEVTTKTIINICKKKHIQNNITHKNLKEIVSICHKKKGHVYINKTYFFIAHSNLYIIAGPKKFWIKEHPTNTVIKKTGTMKIEGLQVDIKDKEYIGKTICFAQKEMKYKGKSRTKWCINQKIPLFRRNIIPLVVENKNNKKILHAFTNTLPGLNESIHQ